MRATQMTIQWALFVGVLFSAAVAGQAGAQSSCLTVDLARPVVFPDGTVRAAGQLTLCDWKAYNPVVRFHRSYVDGFPVQMLMGTRSTNERESTDPDEVFFRRDEAGRLVLIGYARTIGGRSMSVSFQRKDASRRVNRPARALEQKDDLLIVMARPH